MKTTENGKHRVLAPPSPELVSKKGDVGRNDPCPCGSGKKAKRCHLDPARLRTYLYDHPVLSELWDVEALDREGARLKFRQAFHEKKIAGDFRDGRVYRECRACSNTGVVPTPGMFEEGPTGPCPACAE